MHWYRNAIFYELCVRAFRDSNGDGHGDLPGVIERLDYLQELGVDCIWLLPICPSPLRDDGYDVSDYFSIHPDYGTVEDFERLIAEAHSRGLRVITDLVVNHTSDQHRWFLESRASRNNPKRDWYVWSDTDRRYAGARIVFVDTETSNWAYDAQTEQYYWHRFYSFQPDLNYDNPEVRQAMLDVMRFWLDMGIDGFRVDAVPYLYEREGTSCEGLPETHTYLKRMRRFLEENWPDAMMLCEANQSPEEVVAYFGEDDEFHMGFHFPLMPRIFMALRREDATPIRAIMEKTPSIPTNSQWCTFLRNHDELTLEIVSEEERQRMWREYAPDPRMRLNLGIRRRLAPLLDNDLDKIMLANRLLFSLPGSPIIYYGDEIGMGDDIALPDRNGLRTPMQWDSTPNAGFSSARPEHLYAPVIGDPVYGYRQVNVAYQRDDPGSLFNQMRALIALRKRHRAFGRGTIHFLDGQNGAVLAFLRVYEGEIILVIHNLSASRQVDTFDLTSYGSAQPMDMLHPDTPQPPIGKQPYPVTLNPFESKWLLLDHAEVWDHGPA
jgi:maltose alpha-D-glucosyltransferase/alpha-amylase